MSEKKSGGAQKHEDGTIVIGLKESEIMYVWLF